MKYCLCHLLPRLGFILHLQPLWAKGLVHAPQRPVKAMSRWGISFHMKVIKMDFIKHGGHHHCPVGFDSGQQRLCPGKDSEMKRYNNLMRRRRNKIIFQQYLWQWSNSFAVVFLKYILSFETCTHHPSVASIWASKIATTSAVACSQPEIRDWDKPICRLCHTFFISPGLSVWIWSM